MLRALMTCAVLLWCAAPMFGQTWPCDKPCRFGLEWGYDQKGIWVTKGCRAQFALGGYRLPPERCP